MSITYEIIAEWEDPGRPDQGLSVPTKRALVARTETQILPAGEDPEDPEVTQHVYVEEFDFAERPNWRLMTSGELSEDTFKRAIEEVSKRA